LGKYTYLKANFSPPAGTTTFLFFIRKTTGPQYFYADDVTLKELLP